MASYYYFVSGLFFCFFVLSTSTHGAACTGSGVTRAEAASHYADSCQLPVKDCDPLSGQWYCSSENIDASHFDTLAKIDNQAGANSVSVEPPAVLSSVTSQSCIDTDGDGWGWDGVASCQTGGQISAGNSGDLNSSVPAALKAPSNACVDDDADGWGWDGSASCRVTEPVVAVENQYSDTRSDAHCSGPFNPHDITDLILVTGQSNVTGADTDVSATLDQWGKVIRFNAPDQPHPRVFAWTVDPARNNAGTGWQVAALNQSWHDSAPGVGGIARNNFGFHFARQVADRGGCKVVGFIMVSEGGKGIAHWDHNAPGWNEVVMQVAEALSAIGRSTIDGILWHQGESDWIADGTCYTGQGCRNNQPDYYPQKLYSKITDHRIPNPVGGSALIDRLRRESWFGDGKPFIAGETIKAPVNIHLNKLNTDNDRWTACVSSDINSGLGIREDDPFKNHYNAAGLRELGSRYATEYLKMMGR